MKSFFCTILLLAGFVTSHAQTVFDSVSVAGKVKTYVQSVKQDVPVLEAFRPVVGKVENRVDLSSGSFDFSRAEDASYLKERTKKVLVTRYADIRHTGADVYVQTTSTKFPLTNLEIHADAAGKIVKGLPFQEIQQALELLQKNKLLSLEQVKVIYSQRATAASISYANLLIDLPTSTVKWQVRSVPNWQTKRQDLLEIDAASGQVLLQQQQTMNISSATVSQ